MSVRLNWTLKGQDITVDIDATLREVHQGTAQVTEHQVEKGSNITDNIRPLPQKLTLDAFITNTPIKGGILAPTGAPAGSIKQLENTSINTLQFPAQFNRVIDVYEALLAAQRGGALLTISTAIKQYDSFAITSISAPRDAEFSNAVVFSIDLQEIITVSVVEVAAPKAQKKSGGQKVTHEAKAEEQKKVNESFFAALAK